MKIIKGIGRLLHLFWQLLVFPFRLIGRLFDRFLRLFRFSIAFKLTFHYTGLFFWLILITYGVLAVGTTLYLEDTLREDLNRVAALYRAYPEERPLIKEAAEAQGILLFSDEENWHTPSYLRQVTRSINVPGEGLVHFVAGITLDHRARLTLMAALAATLVLALLLNHLFGRRYIRRMLRPIEQMHLQMTGMSGSDLSERIDVRGIKDELKELAITFNAMLDRLEKTYRKKDRFVADASHELRTPLAILKGYANMLQRWGKTDPDVLDESIVALISEVSRMEQLVENLLFLARRDRDHLKFQPDHWPIAPLLEETVTSYRKLYPQKTFAVEAPDHQIVVADGDLFRQLIRIFLDNAAEHTAPDGKILLRAKPSKTRLLLEITDDGRGIAREHLVHLFDRFYRVDDARKREGSGSGLRLAIASEILDLHGFSVDVTSEPGVGTTFTLILSPLTSRA